MNGQMRNKARLFARASTLAILAAAGSLGAVSQAEAACLNVSGGTTVIATDQTCVQVNGVNGDVINEAKVGPTADGSASFFVGKSITGELINNSTVSGGGILFGNTMGALTIAGGADVAGGISNTGQINSAAGNGLQLGFGTTDSHQIASLTGSITNSAGIHGFKNGVAALFGTMSGGLTNNSTGDITGGDAAIFVADTFTNWGGGITNHGNIVGDAAGIQIGSEDSFGSALIFSGGIHNDGTISSLRARGPSILAGGSEFNGGIENSGLITQRGVSSGVPELAGVGIAVTAQTFNGDIYNSYGGRIEGRDGPGIWITDDNSFFNGSFTNDGEIEASSSKGRGTAVEIDSGTFSGNWTNNNYIHGTLSGSHIEVGAFHGNVTNNGVVLGDGGNGLSIEATTLDGGEFGAPAEIANHNLIRGAGGGLVIEGGTIYANLTNEPFQYDGAPAAIIEATGTSGIGVRIGVNSWSGNITNAGTIIADGGEFSFQLLQNTNSTGLFVSAGSFSGDVTNSGLIQGNNYGVRFTGGGTNCECFSPLFFDGTFSNLSGGVISGGHTGVEIEALDYTGDFNNDGLIHGGNVGVAIGPSSDSFFFGKFNGNVTNTGTITGGSTGLIISTSQITGDFTNSGLIHGDIDGVDIVADTIFGDVTNNGTISGGSIDTGLFISAGSMTGNVVNNVLLSAASNALNLQIGTLTGHVTNTGVIESTSGGQAVLLNIGNGTTFRNEGGGLILGDVAFNGTGAYVFSAGDGGIVGSLTGQPGAPAVPNDTIVVDGEHYFIDGTASNFASFTVANGGTALMGAQSIFGSSQSPYSFTNVQNVNVNAGGLLYIDRGTTLNAASSYTQQAGGVLAFDLGAPGGPGFSSLTGTQTAAPGDYGQLLVNGPVTLSGTIAGALDSAFASANPGLTEVIYNDVIISSGPNAAIHGDFTATAVLSNNTLYQLFDTVDGNTVDLRVSRSALGQSASISDLIVGVSDPFDGNISDRTNGIGSGGCALAGPGSCFNRFASNVGATQVMNDASPGEDPFAWLRTGVRRVGETAVWGRGVGVWGDTDGQASINVPGSKFSLGGGIVGIDHVFSPLLLAGAAAQWTTTSVDFKGLADHGDVTSFEFGTYGSYGDTRLYVNANLSYIWHDFDVTRVVGATFAKGNYNGRTISAYVEGGKIFESDLLRIQPIVAVSYAHLDTDAYRERGTAATLLNVDSASFDTLKGMLGSRFAYPFTMESGRKWVPEARVVWSHEFMDDHSSHVVAPQLAPNNRSLVNGEAFSRDTLILGGGLTAPLADDATAYVDYDAGLNTDATTQTVSAGVRLTW